MEKGVVKLFAKITIGSSGAPTLTRGKGIASISRTSTGLYVLTLQDTYQRTLALQGAFIKSSGVPAAPLPPFIVTDAVATAAAPAITFTTSAASGGSGAAQATDPSSGEILLLEITLSNSTAS